MPGCVILTGLQFDIFTISFATALAKVTKSVVAFLREGFR